MSPPPGGFCFTERRRPRKAWGETRVFTGVRPVPANQFYTIGSDRTITKLGVEAMKQQTEAERIAKLEEAVVNLNGWQKTQNGALVRVADQVDTLKNWIMGALLLIVVNIAVAVFK